jgi:hypothetical protein
MADSSIDVTWEGKRIQAAEQARATAMPLTMGKVFWAVFLANLAFGVVISIVYAIVTGK